jgi:hypothetical protein
MEKRCFNCANARANKRQWVQSLGMGMPATLTCLQPVGAPGQMREVLPNGTCPNFRPKPQPPLRVEPPEPPFPGTALIPLTKGLHALVDAADAEWLSKYKWHALVTENGVYAARSAGPKTILMHREIMQPPPGMQVDHKELDSLDNRRENLRVCTPEQNCYNTRSHGGVSGFKGVTPHRDKWEAKISIRGETLHLGLYDDPVEAAKVRDRKALELQGPFAYLNFPEIRDEQKAEDGRQKTQDEGPKAENAPAEPDPQEPPARGPGFEDSPKNT